MNAFLDNLPDIGQHDRKRRHRKASNKNPVDFIGSSKKYLSVDGTKLARRRESLGISQQELADRITKILNRDSLTQQYIQKLEKPGIRDVEIEIAKSLQKALSI